MFFRAIMFLVAIVSQLKCSSMNNQECKVRLQVIDINSNELSFYSYIIKTSKCIEILERY